MVIGVLPFFHIYGMVVVMGGSLREGATIVSMPRFDLEQFLATIQKYRVSYMNLVPPIILALAKSERISLGLRSRGMNSTRWTVRESTPWRALPKTDWSILGAVTVIVALCLWLPTLGIQP